MKKVCSILAAFGAALLCFVFIFVTRHAPEGIACAMMGPMLPKNIWGKSILQRAKDFGNGTFGEGVEWLHDVVYDRMRLVSTNPLTTSLFRNKAGEQRNGVVLTLADTNVVNAQVPTKQKWYLWELNVKYQAHAAITDALMQNVLTFVQNTIVVFTIVNLDKMFTIPLGYFLPFDQLVSAPAVTVASRYPQIREGGKITFKVPLVLEENCVWSLDFTQLVASNAGLDNDFFLFLFDREMFRT
jgi:hypothetical protein